MNPNPMSPLLAQLYALRAQLEAVILTVEQITAMPEEPTTGCPHPQDRQRDASTFARPNMLMCLDCGAEHPGTAA